MNITKPLTYIAICLLVATGGYAQTTNQENRKEKKERKQSRNKKNKDITILYSLSDEQKVQIKEIKQAEQKELEPLNNQIKEKQTQLRELETSDNPELIKIHSTIDEMGVLHTTMAKKKVAYRQEVRNVLTPEQRSAYDAKHVEKQEGRSAKNKKKRKKAKNDIEKYEHEL